MTRILGIMACIVGLCGVIAAVLAHHVIDQPRKQPPGWSAELKLSEKVNLHVGSPRYVEPPAATVLRERVTVAAVIMGCAAIALAVGSWIRREGIALGVMACFLGLAAIAWEQALLVFIVFILVGGPTLWIDRPWERRKTVSE
jgi:hypothetical protein